MSVYKWKILNDNEKDIINKYYTNRSLSSYNYAYCIKGDISLEYLYNNNILFLANISYQNVMYYIELNIKTYPNMYFYKYRNNCGYVIKLGNKHISISVMKEYFNYLDCYTYMLINNFTNIKDANMVIYDYYLLLTK